MNLYNSPDSMYHRTHAQVAQARTLDAMLAEHGECVNSVVVFDVPDAVRKRGEEDKRRERDRETDRDRQRQRERTVW